MVDSADSLDFSLTKTRRARKRHVCGECRREILPGEIYEYFSGKADGDKKVFSTKTCAHCLVAVVWLSDRCGGSIVGGVMEDLLEHRDEENIDTPDLHRLIAGMEKKWSAPDGSLMPVPEPLKAEAPPQWLQNS